MVSKFKQKLKSKEECVKQIEEINYKTVIMTKKTLNSVLRTTEKTSSLLYEQREQLEEISRKSDTVESNLEKGVDLSVKMKRAGKIIVIGDKIGDKIKEFFKISKPKKKYIPTSPPPKIDESAMKIENSPEIEKEPTEQSTNEVLISIRNDLKKLRDKLVDQNKEISNQMPLIKDIKDTNTRSAKDAFEVMKNLRYL